MKVSIIVPNYNHAPFLKKRIDSILNQTYQDFELILMDDCSTDNSRAVLEIYRNNPKVSHVIYNTSNSGSTFKQWEKGIALAKGDFIWIAESDDWAESIMLDKLVSVIKEKTSIVFCRSLRAWSETDLPKQTFNFVHVNYQGQTFIKEKMLAYNSIENASMAIFRKKDIESRWFEEIREMKYCGDWLFWIKLAQKGDVVEFSDVFNYFRQHGGKVTSKAKTLGLDFTEGVKVLEYIESNCNIKIPRNIIKYWAQVWVNTRISFAPGITKKTLQSLLSFRFIFLYYLAKDMAKKRYNTIRKR